MCLIRYMLDTTMEGLTKTIVTEEIYYQARRFLNVVKAFKYVNNNLGTRLVVLSMIL